MIVPGITLFLLLLPGGFVCPTTQPPLIPFVPPNPYPAQPAANSFYLGTDSLWVTLPKNGKWVGSPQKVVWGRAGYYYRSEPAPNLVVTGTRLDRTPLQIAAVRATNAYTDNSKSVMLTGIDIPEADCWEISGNYNGNKLSFIVKVGD
jgi:hypothetical protein